MSEKNNRRNKFEIISGNYSNIVKKGYEFQKWGNELVRFGRIGQKNTEFLNQEYPKYKKLANDNPEFTPYLDEIEKNTEYELKQTEIICKELTQGEEFIKVLVSSTGSASVSGTGSTYVGSTGYTHLQLENPSINLGKKYEKNFQ